MANRPVRETKRPPVRYGAGDASPPSKRRSSGPTPLKRLIALQKQAKEDAADHLRREAALQSRLDVAKTLCEQQRLEIDAGATDLAKWKALNDNTLSDNRQCTEKMLEAQATVERCTNKLKLSDQTYRCGIVEMFTSLGVVHPEPGLRCAGVWGAMSGGTFVPAVNGKIYRIMGSFSVPGSRPCNFITTINSKTGTVHRRQETALSE